MKLSRGLLLCGVALACAGCIGFHAEYPVTHEVQNPVPHVVEGNKRRWACEPDSGEAVPTRYTKGMIEKYWGSPKEKVATAKGETWIYSDDGQWCGLWVFAIVPIPLRLPICDVYDRVEFEDEFAVRSKSRRVVGLGLGLGFHPAAPVPIPFFSRPGGAGSANPVITWAGQTRGGGPCVQ